MLLIAFTIFIVLLSLGAPLWLSIILFALNSIIPDGIPFADEFVQGLSIASRIKNGFNGFRVSSWIFGNPFKFILVVISLGYFFIGFHVD